MKEDYKFLENTTDETVTEGEESYLEDDDSYTEHLEGSSSSLQEDYAESVGGKQDEFWGVESCSLSLLKPHPALSIHPDALRHVDASSHAPWWVAAYLRASSSTYYQSIVD